jgi:UDP-GlcNAc:undecaprenyl-phosphate GlcNAc-1-phosphate transferase
MDVLDAVYGFIVAAAVAAALTPATARFARSIGAVDHPRERGLSARETPLLGGLAILAGVLAASLLFLEFDEQLRAILAGAVVITLVGALDDRFDLPAWLKLLGLLLGCVAIQGSLKTNAILALIFPLLVLTVPFLDTTFVVLKRMKYRRPVYSADRWHLHHRLSNIGFSQRRTVLYLYAWTLIQAGLALALRFVPYSDNGGNFNLGWSLVMIGLGLLALGASVYLVYVLEILKFKRRFARGQPDATDADVQRHLETGEFDAIEDR